MPTHLHNLNETLCPARWVLDTNVVLDLLHFEDPQTSALKAHLACGHARCFTTPECVSELTRVLGYPQLAITNDQATNLLTRYAALAEEITPPAGSTNLPICSDADDQKFLELALFTGASHLVTRDLALLTLNSRVKAHGFEILTPATLTQQLAKVAEHG